MRRIEKKVEIQYRVTKIEKWRVHSIRFSLKKIKTNMGSTQITEKVSEIFDAYLIDL